MVGRKFGFRFASVSLGWSWGRVRFAPLLSVSGGMARTGAHCVHAAPQRAPRRPQRASRRPRTIPHARGRGGVLGQVPHGPARGLRAARRGPRGAGARGACRAPGAHVAPTCLQRRMVDEQHTADLRRFGRSVEMLGGVSVAFRLVGRFAVWVSPGRSKRFFCTSPY